MCKDCKQLTKQEESLASTSFVSGCTQLLDLQRPVCFSIMSFNFLHVTTFVSTEKNQLMRDCSAILKLK